MSELTLVYAQRESAPERKGVGYLVDAPHYLDFLLVLVRLVKIEDPGVIVGQVLVLFVHQVAGQPDDEVEDL